MNALDALARFVFRKPVFPTSNLPVPESTEQRITHAELELLSCADRSDGASELEAEWAADRDAAVHVVGGDFEWSDFDGGTRPDTREGREGR